jgi:hypothetical protein
MEVASGEYGSYVEKLSEAVKENRLNETLISRAKKQTDSSKQTDNSSDEVQIEIGATNHQVKDDNSDCHNSLLVKKKSLSQ